MERFLIQCADYIYHKHTNQLNEVCIVFPNRRSGVFFNSYLQKLVIQPLIGPHVTTINEFICGFSDLYRGEKLLLISELFSIFKKHTQTAETFDEFYFWGEVLLSDFNDIDSYMANARDLFTNISDLKEIEQHFDYLTPEQKAAIYRFWGSMSGSGEKAYHEKFISVWSKLYAVYSEFKLHLEGKGIAYTGMIYRQVAEKFRNNAPGLEFDKYYIIGLNALNECEKVIFQEIRYKTEFLWDYDDFYLKDLKNEAGLFLRTNLARFPPPEDFMLNTSCFLNTKNIQMVAVPSVYAQAQVIPGFLREISTEPGKDFDNCAVVLADESLLFPALGAVPEEFEAVNVTMGYPVKNSAVYGFLLLLVNLLKNFKYNKEGQVICYHRFVSDLLKHQLLKNVAAEQTEVYLEQMKKFNRVIIPLNELNFSALHRLVFSLPEGVNQYSTYFLQVLAELYNHSKTLGSGNQILSEMIHELYQLVGKLGKLIVNAAQEQGLEISRQVFFRLFGQYAGQALVSFEGEPVHGMQVMGILETRCLDFENLLILGFNENKWPRTSVAPSFIPYNIRKGFNLPGVDEQDAMYAYYFFRLVQRAKKIMVTYNTQKKGISTGELSRYGYQLLYDSKLNIIKSTLDFHFFSEPAPLISISRSVSKVSSLLAGNSFDTPLSPTAINMWLQCSLRFYFRYILKLAEPDEMKDEIDSPVFGNIFHETIEKLYKPLVGKVIHRDDLERIKSDKVLIENEIHKAIGKHYFKHKVPGKVNLEGKTILIYENIKIFLQRLIDVDMQLAPFELIVLEKKVTAPLTISVNGKQQDIHLGGVIDRIDRVKDTLRIIDYKTGNVESLTLKEVEELFDRNAEKPKKEILQALMYCMIYKNKSGTQYNLQPAVYSLRKLFEEDFDPAIKMNRNPLNFMDVEKEFSERMKEMVTEIFSPGNNYSQTIYTKNCQYCSYNKICQRY